MDVFAISDGQLRGCCKVVKLNISSLTAFGGGGGYILEVYFVHQADVLSSAELAI